MGKWHGKLPEWFLRLTIGSLPEKSKNLKFKHVQSNRVIEAIPTKFQTKPNEKDNLEQEKCVTNSINSLSFYSLSFFCLPIFFSKYFKK